MDVRFGRHQTLEQDVRFTPNSGHSPVAFDVRFVPIADIALLFDHLVGA